METTDPTDQLKAAATAYKRAKTTYEKAQVALRDAVVKALRSGVRPTDVAEISGWDREYNRRLKKKADEAESAPAAESG